MTGPTDRWRRVEALYHDVLARPVDERAAALVAGCAGDAALQAEVQSLLDQPESAAGFLATPALDLAARHGVPAHSSLTGRRLGVFELQGLLGVGGMGEVYRARDTRLQRDVAIKILPRAFQDDPDRLARFEREARVLASLNHPHIAAIYGVEEAEGLTALVMELVRGDDLSQRIARGKIPVAETLRIARQIASALDAAHDHGVVHRDLKPDNVRITLDGQVKVLDFGLAKMATADGSLVPSNASTMMATTPGLILGTAAYMSPEQARGLTVDKRTDIWAFGCVLYELLTNRSPFAGATVSDTMAQILGSEPDWTALPASTPSTVRRLLQRCLQKDVKPRLRDIGDARIEIDEAAQLDPVSLASQTAPTSGSERLMWASAVALLGVAMLVVGSRAWTPRPATVPPEVRFDIATPEVAHPTLSSSVALSADGRQILFVADSDGQSHVWVRSVDSLEARPLVGTGGATHPFWSPDGRSVAFSSEGFLKRLDLDGGLVRTLARSTVGVGGTWSRGGIILFALNPASAILQVSAEGGPSTAVTQLDPGQVGHAFPHFLPDGRHFLYYVTAGAATRGVYVGRLDGSSPRRLLDADGGGVYTNGHVLFIRERDVFAQPFDAERLALQGSPFRVAGGVFGRAGGQSLTLSAAAGAFAFRAGEARFERQFTWVDRSGTQIATVGDRLANPDGISWSPDRSQLVFFARGATSSDLWTLDTRRGVVSRFTDDAGEDIFPLWARDGDRIIYTAIRNGQGSLYQRHIGTDSPGELLMSPQGDEVFASDTSPDGRDLVYQRMNAKTGWDIWTLPLKRDGTPVPVVQTDADERGARLSPDGLLGGLRLEYLRRIRDLRAAISGARSACARVQKWGRRAALAS